MLINPIRPAVEMYLAVYNLLPSPFRAYLSMVLGLMAATTIIALAMRLK